MKPFDRSDRVAGEIQRILSLTLQKQVKDPDLFHTTVTGVRVTRDLRLARVYFTCPGGETGRRETIHGFQRASGFLKRTLASQLGLRYMPDLEFLYDESFDYGDRIDRLLKSLQSEHGSDHRSSEE